MNNRCLIPLNIILLVVLALTITSCHHRNKTAEEETFVDLNEQTVTDFAQSIARGIVNGDAQALNNAIDKENIKQLVSENSIVYSGFDVEGGQRYFEKCLQLGEPAAAAVNNGGDFAFTRFYKKGDEYHIVFRTYDNFVVDFADFIVDTVKGKLMIEDGFIYHLGCNLSKSVQYGMLYNLMLQTNPDADVKWLQQAEEMTQAGQSAQALALLKAHKEAIQEYPLFYQLWIANLYKTDKSNFLNKVGELESDDLDSRYLALHKLLYSFNEGKVSETESIVNELIPNTGDDPIFLFLYGYANLNAKQHKEALDCFTTVDKSMPLIWDLWQGELKCYKNLHDQAGLDKCLQKGKRTYGMSDEELKELKF